MKRAKKLRSFSAALILLFPVILITVYVLALFIRGGEDYTFQPQWQEGFQKASKVFVDNGMCAVDHSECLDKNTMYVVGKKGGFRIDVYGVDDHKILEQVYQIFADEFYSHPKMKRMEIVAYPYTKSYDLSQHSHAMERPPVEHMELKRQ